LLWLLEKIQRINCDLAFIVEFVAVQIKWFGTHLEHDRIDVGTAQYKKR